MSFTPCFDAIATMRGSVPPRIVPLLSIEYTCGAITLTCLALASKLAIPSASLRMYQMASGAWAPTDRHASTHPTPTWRRNDQ